MTQLLEEIYSLLNQNLILECPVLSGNMYKHIKIADIGDNEVTLEIDAPFYDMKEWRKTGVIKLIGNNINGFTDYAYWVNKNGGFSTHNSSEGWVDRNITDVLDVIKNVYGNIVVIDERGK